MTDTLWYLAGFLTVPVLLGLIVLLDHVVIGGGR